MYHVHCSAWTERVMRVQGKTMALSGPDCEETGGGRERQSEPGGLDAAARSGGLVATRSTTFGLHRAPKLQNTESDKTRDGSQLAAPRGSGASLPNQVRAWPHWTPPQLLTGPRASPGGAGPSCLAGGAPGGLGFASPCSRVPFPAYRAACSYFERSTSGTIAALGPGHSTTDARRTRLPANRELPAPGRPSSPFLPLSALEAPECPLKPIKTGLLSPGPKPNPAYDDPVSSGATTFPPSRDLALHSTHVPRPTFHVPRFPLCSRRGKRPVPNSISMAPLSCKIQGLLVEVSALS